MNDRQWPLTDKNNSDFTAAQRVEIPRASNARGALFGNKTIASVFDIISKPARRSEVVMLKVRL